MNVFEEYAELYDLLYEGKDYAAEASAFHSLIERHRGGARTLLDLGCGTGRYEEHFADLGYSVTGMDMSEGMLESARRSAAARKGVQFLQGDMRSMDLGRRFDVVQALFHVVSYLSGDDDVASAFDAVRRHLSPGGIFVFDCWHGPGVLSDPPTVRVLERRSGDLKVWRVARPRLHPASNLVDVDYTILSSRGDDAPLREIRESHRMRYFFLPELRRFLSQSGLLLVEAHPSWNPGGEIGTADWHITVVARSDDRKPETIP